MRKKLFLPVLILIAFRFGYAQQTDTGSDIISEPALNESIDKEKKSDYYIPLNLREGSSLIIELNDNLKIKGLQDEVSSVILKKNNVDNHYLSVIDTGKYHRFLPEYNPKSNMLIPIGEVMAINIGLSLFNNYVTNAEFAKISFKSVSHNLDTGFVWDDDMFVTNQFGHPYHGGLYFTTARSLGYSFWESIPFAFGGSLMWETFMETDPPQANDLIQTTIGGTMLGEMTYRLSSLILDESTSGGNRLFREITAAIISPIRAINRLFKGDMARKTPQNVHDVFPVIQRINLGYAGVNPNEQVKFEKNHIMFEYLLTYGDPFKQGIVNPFDIFRLRLGFDAKKGDKPSSWVYAYGLLYGTNLIKRPDSRFIFGAFHDYDFFFNQAFRLGTQSVGLGLIYISPVKSDWKSVISFHSNFIALGALNSIYHRGEYRDYDYGIGNKTMLEATLSYGPAMLLLEYRFYYLKTINGFPGHSSFGFFNPKLLVDIYDGFGLGLEYIFYHRFGTFENVADYSKRTSEQRLYMSYHF